MKLHQYLYKKINDEMRIIYITETNPKKKVKLDPLNAQDLNVDLSVVARWSQNNKQLYELLIANGMAEFICNREFLNQFYTHLQFMYSGIVQIDSSALKLKNLKVINLFHNKIVTIQNIPQSCKQLYLDFNQLSEIKLKNNAEVELLSVSHNRIDDKAMAEIARRFPLLRCFNCSYNRIEKIKNYVSNIRKCQKVKILIARNNPISMLQLYWDYITTQIQLDYFDNQKYVKPEPIKQKVAQPPKQQKKQQKKDTKKDTKKGGKAQQKPIQQQKKPEPKPQQPKIRTDQNFKQSDILIQISTIQNLSGTIYDPSIFPQQNLTPKKTQSCFWAVAEAFDKKYSTQQNKIQMDSIMPDGDINRLNFQFQIQEKMEVNYGNFQKIGKGMVIFVYKSEPVVETDGQSGEQKVVLDEKKQITIKNFCIGGTFVDLELLLSAKKKDLTKNYNLFKQQAVLSPFFKKPLQNQSQQITQNKVQFQHNLTVQLEQARKKAQQQQAQKSQKKGGKDTKKAPPKKQVKKDAKQPVADKKIAEKCPYPADTQQYRYLGQGRMYKCLGEKLGVRVVIQ